MSLRTRLAPTPSGYLHIGNAVSFLFTWAFTRAQDGWVMLRIDDLDASRRRPEYVEDIFRTLEWLGIDYDMGPEGPEDLRRHYAQKLRLPQYLEALRELREQGHLYACTCSRRDIRRKSRDGNYPGTCIGQHKDFEAPKTAWRVQVPKAQKVMIREWQQEVVEIDLAADMGDFIVRQKNRAPAYQIASLVDDEQWQINFIVRGADLQPSTAAQLYLAQLLNYRGFSQVTFRHHELITGTNGRKLSKSEGADALKNVREAGKDPGPIIAIAAEWLGLESKSIRTAGELVEALQSKK